MNTNTCGTTTADVPSLKDLLDVMQRMPRMAPTAKVLTHPSNAPALRQAFHVSEEATIDPLVSVPVEFRSFVPPRRIRKVWHPPKGGRFTEYGPEDEAWMRPLGLGTVEEVDDGPLIVFMQERVMQRIEREIVDESFRFFTKPTIPLFKPHLALANYA